jgi:hypothetical protein
MHSVRIVHDAVAISMKRKKVMKKQREGSDGKSDSYVASSGV